MRYGLGVEFFCPRHFPGPKKHRLELWFHNPLDHGTPNPGATLLAWRTGDNFVDITLAPGGVDLGEPFDFGECWKLWLVEGAVYISSDETPGNSGPVRRS